MLPYLEDIRLSLKTELKKFISDQDHWPIQRGGALGRSVPSRANFFHFHVVFDKKTPNNMFSRPPLELAWIRH